MKAIEMATSHLKSLISDSSKITVDQWKNEQGKPLDIYHEPLTLWEREQIEKKSGSSELKMAAHIIIMKAKDRNGDHLFKEEDFDTLYRGAHSAVVADIAKTILGNQSDVQGITEEMEKN